MSPAAGTRLGPYEIVDKLGAGGMGDVYRARDTRLDRIVAIKVSKSIPGSIGGLSSFGVCPMREASRKKFWVTAHLRFGRPGAGES